MNLVLLIRRTESYWRDGKIDLHRIIKDTTKVEKAISKWDLNVEYLAFRKKLREISELTITQNNFDMIIPWSDKGAVESLPDGTWLVPMDEDDWLAPDFTNVFKNTVVSQSEVVTWPTHRTHANGSTVVNNFVESCGYAVRLPVDDWRKITNHMIISPYYLSLSGCLSVRNETIASVGYLLRSSDALRDVINSALKKEYRDDPEWARGQRWKYLELLGKC